MNINTLDFNLLKVFNALMNERNVTRAGEAIGLAQSSMSNALSRLRYAFDDELFVRTPTGMVPTARAESLNPLVQEVLANMQTMIDVVKPFDPAKVSATVKIATSDNVKILLAPHIAKHLQTFAPNLEVRFLPLDKATVFNQMDSERVHITIGTFGELPKRFLSQRLYRDSFVCLARHQHPKLSKGLSLRRFAEIPHILMTLRDDNTGLVDSLMIEKGLNRRVAVTVDQFTVIPHIVQQTDYLALCPKTVVDTLCRSDECQVFDVPLKLPTWDVTMLWTKGSGSSPLISWLRAALSSFAEEISI